MSGTTPATRAHAKKILHEFLPRAGRDYESLRNYDNGCDQHVSVSKLSPYLRCRLITEAEVIEAVLSRHDLASADKFVQEVAWRSYWKGWLAHHPHVWANYQADLSAYHQQGLAGDKQTVLNTLLSGESAIACMNEWLAELKETGYLHNHARMWFASIWIFTLGLPWQLGADLFLKFLLDGDAASNTLSWRWVAGLQTRGKHYLASADNIAKFTRGRFNPIDQLVTQADPLTEPHAVLAPSPPSWPEGNRAPRAVLLTDDDLSVETLFDLRHLEVVVILRSTALRATNGVSGLVETFVDAAFEDALTRLRTLRPDLEVTQCDQLGGAVSDTLAHRGINELAVAYCPVGHSADALQLLVEAWPELNIQPCLRAWDKMTWPHAQRGFFRFKRELPGLLEGVGRVAGDSIGAVN